MVSFKHLNTALGLVLLTSLSTYAEDISVPLEDCQLDIVRSKTFGASAGTPWCAMQLKNGDLINKISVWTLTKPAEPLNDVQIRGLRIQYTSGKSTMIGGEEGTLSEHEWTPFQSGPVRALGDQNVYLSDKGPPSAIWGTSPTDRPLKTLMLEWPGVAIVAGGRTGGDDWPRTLAYLENLPKDFEIIGGYASVPIEGELVGLSGYWGQWGIEKITFHMLSADISSVAVHDVVFSPSIEEINSRMSNEDRGMQIQTLKSVVHVNEREDINTTFRLIDTITRQDWTSWSKTTSNLQHYGVGVEISYNWSGIFSNLDATGKADFFWDHSVAKTNMSGSSDNTQLSINMETIVKPKTAVHGWAYTVEGHQDVDWTGKATIDFSDDHTLDFDVGGHIESVQHIQAWSHFEDLTPEQVQGVIASGEAELVDENGHPITSTPSVKTSKRFVA